MVEVIEWNAGWSFAKADFCLADTTKLGLTSTPIAPPKPPGITFTDTDGKVVDAHGGGIVAILHAECSQRRMEG